MPPLPPDPVEYDSRACPDRAGEGPRGAVHRRRPRSGPGARARARSATTASWLVAMVVALILGGFVLGDRARRSRPGARPGDGAAPRRRAGSTRPTWAARGRRARRDAARPHPDPRRSTRRRPTRPMASCVAARRIAAIARRPPASSPRSSSPNRVAARSTPACAATGPVASRCSSCRTSTSSRRRPSAGATTRSRPTSSTATSTVAARST